MANFITYFNLEGRNIFCIVVLLFFLPPVTAQNLLNNPSAEDSLSGWTVASGNWTSLCAHSPEAVEGPCKFWAGWTTKDAQLYQDVDLASDATAIDDGSGVYTFGAWVRSHWEDIPDTSIAILEYYGARSDLLGNVISRKNFEMDCWSTVQLIDTVPVGTRTVRVILRSIQASPVHNNGYFDQLYFGEGADLPDPYEAFPMAAQDSLTYHLQRQALSGNSTSQAIIGKLFDTYSCAPTSDWVQFFRSYFHSNLYTDHLRWIQYHAFFWGSENKHKKLQAALTTVAIEKLNELHDLPDMNRFLVDNRDVRISLFNFQLYVRDLFLSGKYSEFKLQVLAFYENMALKHPRLMKKGVTLTSVDLPYTGGFKFQSISNLLELLDLDLGLYERISAIIGMDDPSVRQPYKDIWEEYRLLIMDNNQFRDHTIRAIEDLLSNVPRKLFHLKAITAIDYLSDPDDEKLRLHGAGVNVFEGDITRGRGNPWPSDFQSVQSNAFMEVLAHEFCHNVDGWNLYPKNSMDRFFLDRRKILLEAAGLEDLQYLRSQVGGQFFNDAPQELIASIGNQYMTHSLETLRLGLERFEKGFKHPINQFLYMANIFSGHSDTTNFYTIGTDAKVHHFEHQIRKNAVGHINELHISEAESYRFFLDEQNFVAGILEVEVTDNLCESAANGRINIRPVGVHDFTYTWKDGSKDQTRSDLQSGSYIVLVISPSLGISEELTITVGILNNIQLEDVTAVSCYGAADGSATISIIGDDEDLKITWDNGEQGLSASALSSGTHTINIEQTSACSVSLQVEVGSPDSISIEVLQTRGVSCADYTDGYSSVDVSGGTGGYSIIWENEERGHTASFLSAGLNEVIVKDTNGCEKSAFIQIGSPDSLRVDFQVTADSTFYDVRAIATGGTGSYTYHWDDSGRQMNQTAEDLVEGYYTVTVTDENGCTITGKVEVSSTTSNLEADIPQAIVAFPNPTSDILHVDLKDISGAKELDLVDLKGKWLNRWSFKQSQMHAAIDLTDLIKGLYLLRIKSDSVHANLLVIKQ